MAEQLDRFRSFCERYVIARAGTFEVGREQEQAWLAIQDAKKVYGMCADAKNETDPAPTQAGVGGVAQGPSTPAPLLLRNAGPRNAAKAANPVAVPVAPILHTVEGPSQPWRPWRIWTMKGQGHGTTQRAAHPATKAV